MCLQFLGRPIQNKSGTSQQVPGPTVPITMVLLTPALPIPMFLSSCLLGSHPLSGHKLLLFKDSKMGTQVGLLLSSVNVSLNSRKRWVVEIWV